MSEVELFTFAALLAGTFIAASAYTTYCSALFLMRQQGSKTLIPVAILVAWLIVTAIGVGVIYVLLMAHSQRDAVLAMLRGIGIGYPILGIVFIFALSSLNKRYIPTTKGQD